MASAKFYLFCYIHVCQKIFHKYCVTVKIKNILIWDPYFDLETNKRFIRWKNLISTCAIHI